MDDIKLSLTHRRVQLLEDIEEAAKKAESGRIQKLACDLHEIEEVIVDYEAADREATAVL